MFRKLRVAAPVLALACGFAVNAAGQESSSRPDEPASSAMAPDAPSLALRDLLATACAHDEKGFAASLTARNAESFTRLSPAARTELMKRFVLLDGAGKPSLTTNANGRPSVRCTTADGAAEIQLGGTDLRDNLALLPLDIRDVSDLRAGDPHHILMGMIRENGAWKILSVGMLFLDLPSLEIEWDRAAIGDNERNALAALRAIAEAVEKYRKTYSRLPDSIAKLGPSAKPSAEAAGLVEAELSAGQSNGYSFRMVIVGANEVGAPAQYELSAIPAIYGRTGSLSLFRDTGGGFHAADHHGGVGRSTDPAAP
jgi:hypothetical protein